MQDKNNIQNKDIFSESIKNKLENYSMPVDESVWAGIEKQLAPKTKRIVPMWFWLSGGVAASLALLLLLNPFKSANTPLAVNNTVQTEVAVTSQQVTAISQIAVAQPQTNSFSANKNQIKKTVVAKVISSKISKKISEKISFVSQNIDKNTQVENSETTTRTTSDKSSAAFQAKEVNSGLANNDLQVKDSIPAKKTGPQLASLPEIPNVLPDPNEKSKKSRKSSQKNNWLLAANFSTNGSADIIPTSNGDLFANATQLTVSDVFGKELNALAVKSDAYILQPNDFDNVEYLPPVSIGFSIQKPVTSNVSIGTGLVYTYLRSNYSLNNQWQNANASLNLHYLGIPVNVNVTVAEKKSWKYYVSIGATIEKGLRSIYKQDITYNDGTQHQTDVYSKIDGIQTSADAAFGVGYKLDKKWSLFFEPKIIYYFENNQPMSARTQTPLNVGFNSGLKLGI